MKLAVLSDIHSNLEALTASLDAVDQRGVDAVFCLGDIVGYGADPAACVELIRDRCTGIVLGNHDAAVGANLNVDRLPRDGREAAIHNRTQLSEEQNTFLRGLPLRIESDGCTFVHATPERPEDWLRLDSFVLAKNQFLHFDTPICFVGHTHIPAVLPERLGIHRVRPGHRFLVNAGSVGQPRDHNPRASFAILDTESFECEIVRVPYNVDRAANKIVEEGLPVSLARRLKVGR